MKTLMQALIKTLLSTAIPQQPPDAGGSHEPSADARFYYLRNFHVALQWLATRYADLLDAQESEFIAEFQVLPRASRALLVRLLMRKGPVFRAGALSYEEIGCAAAAATPLLDRQWLNADPVLDLDQLFRVLTRADLAQLFSPAELPSRFTKAQCLDALRGRFVEPLRWSQWKQAAQAHLESSDAAMAPQGLQLLEVGIAPLIERLGLMFFGNLRQDWSEFVLADLGIFQYERVTFSSSSRAFQTRDDIQAYLRLHRLRERFEQGDAWNEVLPDVRDEAPDNPWLQRRRDKLLFSIARHCERLQDWPAALQIYRECAYPGARHRSLRVLERSERYEEALTAAMDAGIAPDTDAEAQLIARMIPRLRRKLGLPSPSAAMRPGVATITLRLPRPQSAIAVELLARDHLARDHAPTYYVENTLVGSLFGLLCWPAIFQPVPGAFFHPFQRGPADLHGPDFVAMRRQSFQDCLALLDDGGYKLAIEENYRGKSGVQSPFVFWGTLTEPLLKLALHCLPAAHLKLWFQRMLADIKANGSGFPDLIQFWPHEQRYEMIEVKGPGDRLQDNQSRWMSFNLAHGIPVKLCHVAWTEQGA